MLKSALSYKWCSRRKGVSSIRYSSSISGS